VVNGDAAGLTVEMAAVAATVDVVPARDPGPDVGARKLVHTVATGDTIISIAVQYNVDWKALLDLNGLADNTLLALGQEIKLP
jgi:LysM repeat protein